MNFSKVLGIPYDADERTVKRAYAALIKQYRPDTHPAEFAEVREAYEAAMQALRHRRRREEEEEQRDFTHPEPAVGPPADDPSAEARTETSGDQKFERVVDEAPPAQTGDQSLTDALDDPGPFARVLTEPPVLAHSDAAPEEETRRDFERVLTEPPPYLDPARPPEIHKLQEFERVLTTPPVMAPPDLAPEGEARHEFERVVTDPPKLALIDMPPIEPDAMGNAKTLAAMLAEFEEHAGKANEEEQLQRYRAHARMLADWPLDFQMDYEQGLLAWLLSSENPSLLVFQEADQRYHWEPYSIAIMRTHGERADHRYSCLRKLTKLFAVARATRNPFLLLESETYRRAIPIDDSYSAQRAQEQCAAWQLACQEAGLPRLAPRLTYTKNRDLRVYWADIMVGAIAAWVEWLLLLGDPTPLMWLRVLLVGVAALPVVVAVRGIARWVSEKLRPVTSRVNAWRTAWRTGRPRLADTAVWALFLALAMGILCVMPFVNEVPALVLVPGLISVTVLTFMVWLLYRTLTRIEVALTTLVLKLMRLGRWLRRMLAPS